MITIIIVMIIIILIFTWSCVVLPPWRLGQEGHATCEAQRLDSPTLIGWHYLVNATCLTRTHLMFA